jgi:hypothetical protein
MAEKNVPIGEPCNTSSTTEAQIAAGWEADVNSPQSPLRRSQIGDFAPGVLALVLGEKLRNIIVRETQNNQ